MKLTLTLFSFVAENATICKEAAACCFGLGARRTDAAANRVYHSVKRCECVKSEEDCSDLCNCQLLWRESLWWSTKKYQR